MAKQSISERALATQHQPEPATGLVPVGAITVGGRTYTGIKQAVVPTLRQPENTAVVFTVIGRMVVGKQMPPDAKGNVQPRATTMRVTSLQNGRLYDYIVPAVLIGTFVTDYDGGKIGTDGKIVAHTEGELKGYNDYSHGTHTYVGKSFYVQKGMKPDGKRYRDIEALEIDPAVTMDAPGSQP